MTDPTPDRNDPFRLHLLVLRCQAGDEHAFARLMDRFGDATLRYLEGIVGDGAEDVHQEVWLTVYRRLASLTDPRAFRTWLYRTTRHRALDHLRTRQRERQLFADDTDHDVPAPPPDDDPPDAELLSEAIATLGALHREVLLLRYRDELSYAEIAVVVGCSIGTVRSRIHYARHRLREVVAGRSDVRRSAGAPSTRGLP